MSEPDQAELAGLFRARLLDEAADLERQSGETAAQRAPVELDQQAMGRLSRMDDIQSQEMAQAADRRRRQRGAMIAAALKRMDQDRYGDCLGCGEPIEPKRLEADPAAAQCLGCADGRRG